MLILDMDLLSLSIMFCQNYLSVVFHSTLLLTRISFYSKIKWNKGSYIYVIGLTIYLLGLEDSYSMMYKLLFKKILFIFRERGSEGEKEGEKHWWERCRLVASCAPQLGTWPATQACVLTGNWTGDLLVCRLVLNPLNHTSQTIFLKRSSPKDMFFFLTKLICFLGV